MGANILVVQKYGDFFQNPRISYPINVSPKVVIITHGLLEGLPTTRNILMSN